MSQFFFILLYYSILKKLVLILTLFFGLICSNNYVAQSGGRKREHKNQRGGGSIFKRSHSEGNADKFARGAGRKGLFARLFKKDRPSWVYHSTKSGKAQKRETRRLFTRFRTKGRVYNEQILAKQNSDRARKRVRGNGSFNKRKYGH